MASGGGRDPRQLAEQNIRLAYRIAHDFRSCGIEFEELTSIAFLGLVKAASKFAPDSGNKFATYAVPVIRNEILQELRKMRRRNMAACVSLDAETEDGCLVAEMIPDQKDLFSEIYVSVTYKECMGLLTEKEKAIIIPLIFNSETQEQISVRLGVSQSYVSRIYKRAKEKMRKVI